MYDDSWSELCLIDIKRKGGTAYKAHAFTTDITDWNDPEKPMEFVPNTAGGFIAVRKPMTPGSFTLKCYPVSASIQTASTISGGVQWFHPLGSDDISEPVTVTATPARNKHQVVFLWAQTMPATASTVPATSTAAYRKQYKDVYITAYKESFEDRRLVAEMKFEFAPMDKDGNSNIKVDSQDGAGSAMPAVDSYS